jgi:high-affinity Fe2+/Pb2+ permease
MDTPRKHHSTPAGREGLLTVILTALVAGAFLFFMILVTGGFFFYVVLSLAVMVGLGFFHYMLWGYTMTAEVADEEIVDSHLEREEQRERDQTGRFNGDRQGPETRIK